MADSRCSRKAQQAGAVGSGSCAFAPQLSVSAQLTLSHYRMQRLTVRNVVLGLVATVLLIVATALAFWSHGTIRTSDGVGHTWTETFHAGLFLYCPSNSSNCFGWSESNDFGVGLCYNYQDTDTTVYYDMCNSIFAAQGLIITAIVLLGLSWIVRVGALCCCPITWGKPRCTARSCSALVTSFMLFTALMFIIASISLWNGAMTDFELDMTLASSTTTVYSATTRMDVSFYLALAATIQVFVWLLIEVFMATHMIRNRGGYQELVGYNMHANVNSCAVPPPPYCNDRTPLMAAPAYLTTPPPPPPAAAVAAAGSAVPAASGSTGFGSRRFCGSCGAEVTTKFCTYCSAPSMA